MKEKSQKELKNKNEMQSLIESLQEKLSLQSKENEAHKSKIQNQQRLINDLYEKIKLQSHRQYGKSSEKQITDHPQASLFDEAQLPDDREALEAEEETITVPEHERKVAKKKGRKPLPESLPRVKREYDLSDAEKTCGCGCTLTCIGETISEQLDYIPAKVQVIQHARKKYACQGCKETIKEAKLPKQPITKGIASPGLLSFVCVSKFEDYLPLYRQEKIFRRIGVDIPRASLSNWVIRCGELLKPLYDCMRDQLIEYDVASADETTVQVLNEPGRKAENKSYMWLFSGGPPESLSYLYHYAPSRSHEIADNFLMGFKGYLHCDGYVAYDSLAKKRDITLAACWYHVRRKFVEAQKVSQTPGLAAEAIKMIRKLSKIEAKAKKLKPKGIENLRNKEARPILKKLKIWLDDNTARVLPQCALGKAFSYTLNQWPKLQIYLEDGRLYFDNNHSERAIKPFVMGRKNWLFSNSIAGAESAAVIYSVIETCKAHKIPVYDYLRHVYAKLPAVESIEQLESLLPYRVDQSKFISSDGD